MAQVFRLLLTIVIAAVIGAVGMVAGFYLFVIIGQAMGASNREGALAMGAAGLAPIAGVVMGLVGLWPGWWIAKRTPPAVAGFVSVPILVGGIGAGAWFGGAFDPPPPPDPNAAYYYPGTPPEVAFEVRLDRKVPAEGIQGRWQKNLRTHQPMNYVAWEDDPVREEDGVTILRLATRLAWRHDGRVLEVWEGEMWPESGPRYLFDLDLAAVPEMTQGFGDWHRVDRVEDNGTAIPAPDDLQIHARWWVRAYRY